MMTTKLDKASVIDEVYRFSNKIAKLQILTKGEQVGIYGVTCCNPNLDQELSRLRKLVKEYGITADDMTNKCNEEFSK
jgi:hypothetical protein